MWLWTVVSKLIDVSYLPQLLEDVEDILSCTTFEEDSLSRKLNCKCVTMNPLPAFSDDSIESWLTDFLSLSCVVVWLKVAVQHHAGSSWTWRGWKKSTKQSWASALPLVRLTEPAALCWASLTVITLYSNLLLNTHLLLFLFSFILLAFLTEMRRKASPWQRNLGYPLAMLVLLALTVHAHLLIYSTGCFNSFINTDSCFNCSIITVHVSSGDVCTDGLFQCVGVAPRWDCYAQRNGGEDLAKKNSWTFHAWCAQSQSSVYTDDCYFCCFRTLIWGWPPSPCLAHWALQFK